MYPIPQKVGISCKCYQVSKVFIQEVGFKLSEQITAPELPDEDIPENKISGIEAEDLSRLCQMSLHRQSTSHMWLAVP